LLLKRTDLCLTCSKQHWDEYMAWSFQVSVPEEWIQCRTPWRSAARNPRTGRPLPAGPARARAAGTIGPNGSVEAMARHSTGACLLHVDMEFAQPMHAKSVDHNPCRLKINCTFHNVPIFVLLWEMWRKQPFKTIHLMQFCAPPQCLTSICGSLPIRSMHG
jgi:hypothetical protein